MAENEQNMTEQARMVDYADENREDYPIADAQRIVISNRR